MISTLKMNFGVPKYVSSRRSNQELIRFNSITNPGHSYLFSCYKKRIDENGDGKSYWRCTECFKLKQRLRIQGTTANISVSQQGNIKTILTDPEAGHHEQCTPLIDSEIEANQIIQETKAELRLGTKRPLEAYTDACAEISKRFKLAADHNAVVDAMPKYKTIRRSLYAHADHGTISIDDYRNLPPEYQKTYRGRHSDPEDPHYNDQWLLFSNDDMLIFSSKLDLEVLHESSTWIVDGTFKVCPPNFKQLYTILGYGRYGNEAIPLVFALLKGKTQVIYEVLLSNVRTSLLHQFGSIGQLSTILADFEIAMHQSIRSVFPVIRVRGCNFHFGQALVRHFEGLKSRLEDKDSEICVWFGCVKALALLPPPLITIGWDVVLLQKLQNGFFQNVTVKEHHHLQQFANYFSKTWLNNVSFPLDLWNHWDNFGPRTTNHAEGYHSLLNRIDIDQMHPSLKNFLCKLQLMHNRWQQQLSRLQRNVVEPDSGDPTYIDLHNRIIQTRNTFYQRTSAFWDFEGFDPRLMQNNDFQALCSEIDQYLQYMRHLVGKKSKVT